MERHANYALVGVLTTLLIIGGLVFVVWLGNAQLGHKTDRYRIVFQGPLRGVAKGGEVQFNGIKVGEVTDVRLAPQDSNKILVDVEIDQDAPVRTDSLASTEMQGISGVNAILISAGVNGGPLLRDVSHDDPPLIRSKPSAMASMLEGGGQVVEKASLALDRINRLLSDRTIANLSGTVSDLKQVSGAMAANRAMFDRASSAMARLDTTMVDAQATVRDVHGLVKGDGRRAVANVADAAADLKTTIAQAHVVLGNIARQTDAKGDGVLPQVSESMRSLQQTSDDLDGLIRSIRQDPRGTLFKGKSSERELQP